MKTITTIALVLCSIVTWGQTKLTDSTIKAWSINDKIGINTLATPTPSYVRKPDTILCYFLKVPAVIEFPLQAIGAQWYMGYYVSDYNSWHSSYLYLNKAPVKEQVLMSIPKQSK